nr:hypothetical protein [Candidatus Sigynarchaeota archaeon]
MATGTCVAGNGGVRSYWDNVAPRSPVRSLGSQPGEPMESLGAKTW